MEKKVHSFLEILSSREKYIKIFRPKFINIVYEYDFQYITQNFSFNQIPKIIKNIQDSKIIVINFHKEQITNEIHFIFGFQKTILIIHNESLHKIIKFISNHNSQIEFNFISDECRNIFKQYNIDYKECEILGDQKSFEEELLSFISYFELKKSIVDESFKEIFKICIPCITGYIIKRSYSKLNYNRLYSNDEKINININMDNIIDLRLIGSGSIFYTELKYDILNDILLIFKKPRVIDEKIEDLTKREKRNYSEISHPFIPKFYGVIKNQNEDILVLEFINGHTLENIQEYSFTKEDKMNIIFQIVITINYLHKKDFVYRDLKPDNIMIDQNKNVILIDYDRMIYSSEKYEFTNSFGSEFVAPEVNKGEISAKNDIFSFGQVIYFIMSENLPKKINYTNDNRNSIDQLINEILSKNQNVFEQIPELSLIYKQCIDKDPKKRPTSYELMFELYSIFLGQINESIINRFKDVNDFDNILNFNDAFISKKLNKAIDLLSLAANLNIANAEYVLAFIYMVFKNDKKQTLHFFELAAKQNHSKAQYNLGYFYLENGNIDKALDYLMQASNQCNENAYILLGIIYLEGKHVSKNIEKAIYYLKLAANKNNVEAIYKLGTVYYKIKNIKEAIHYFTIAADKGYDLSRYDLAVIYYDNNNIEKAIYYLEPAAENNNSEALFLLGFIYYDKEYIKYDINKAIHYFIRASDLNNSDAQHYLGMIYINGEYVEKNINKAINYFKLAADQNNGNSLYNLGVILFEGLNIERNIIKGIHYLEKAANLNNVDAYRYLCEKYLDKKSGIFDITKGIKYLKLAAKENDTNALYKLGIYYSKGEFVPLDINESIKYFKLAADRNNADAQFTLGLYYYQGKYISFDIDKSIYYFTLSANQNHINSCLYLGLIYYDNKFVSKDVNKVIHYFSIAANQKNILAHYLLAIIYKDLKDYDKAIQYLLPAKDANDINSIYELGYIYYYIKKNVTKAIDLFLKSARQNHPQSQCILGYIYSEDNSIPRDIYKAIYYYSHAADQNYAEAQYKLGNIYYEGKYIKKDVNLAIHYYLLAANQNYANAQYMIGIIHYDGEYVKRDVNKMIKYFSLAANQNHSTALFFLGMIYLTNYFVKKDFNKAFHYLILSNKSEAQLTLGYIYSKGFNEINMEFVKTDMNKAINFFKKASNNGNIMSYFVLGYFYHEGKYVTKDINKAIHYYKEASSFKNNYAKNNLAIIYRHGVDNKIQKNIGSAIEYLEEAIKQENDKVAKFNLAHIYIYEEGIERKIDQSIDLLFESVNVFFEPAINLLCIVLIKKYGFDFKKIEKEIFRKAKNQIHFIIIEYLVSFDENKFNEMQKLYEAYDYLYSFNYTWILSKDLEDKIKIEPQNNLIRDITSDFYDGFGL